MKIHRCELLSSEGCAKKMKRSECTKECIQLALLSQESRKRNISEQEGDKIHDSRCSTRDVTAMHAKLLQLKLLKKLSQQSKTSSMLRLLHRINVKTMDDRITCNILLYNLTVLIHHSSLRIRQRVSIIFKKLCRFLRFSTENESEEQCNAYKNTHARVPNDDKPFDLLRLFKKNNNVTDGALIFALEDTDPQVRTNALNAIFPALVHSSAVITCIFVLP
ncbi:hypothetical protein THOM_2380 [Trachipleistophora hominis]|uniref:Uncharacterized protein n=1 Tax=Trachipleistophora hominis TaxID=72359 RepID=L7JTB3_TRAHO|nr:hypothetical protein THOM_2380 [Trachipleistophora hominis]